MLVPKPAPEPAVAAVAGAGTVPAAGAGFAAAAAVDERLAPVTATAAAVAVGAVASSVAAVGHAFSLLVIVFACVKLPSPIAPPQPLAPAPQLRETFRSDPASLRVALALLAVRLVNSTAASLLLQFPISVSSTGWKNGEGHQTRRLTVGILCCHCPPSPDTHPEPPEWGIRWH